MKYRDLKFELMMGWDTGDRWGSAMSLFFDVAETMYRRELDIPGAWEFRAGALGVGDPETYQAEILADDADDDSLLRLGNALHRYTDYLDRIGESY